MVLGKKQATASDSSIAVAGDVKNSTIEIGFSKEEYESGLRELETRVVEQLSRIYEKEIERANSRANTEARKAIELELQLKQIREKLNSIDQAYAKTIEDLRDSAQTIRRLQNIISASQVEHALSAISSGPNQAFEAWAEIANSKCEEPLILFQAGKMAEINFNYSEALRLFLRANEIDENFKYLNAMGHLNFLMGNYPDAKKQHLRALVLYPDVDDPFKATLLHNLAELYSAEDDFINAESKFKDALNIRKRYKIHDRVASTMNSLAGLYKLHAQNKGLLEFYEQAKPLYINSIKLFEDTLGEHHPETLLAKNNLGLLYLAQQDFKSAKKELKNVLEITRKYRGERHHDTAIAMSSLAGVYQEKKRLKKAKKLHKAAKYIFEYVLGKSHPYVALSLNNLAGISFSEKNYSKAVKSYRKALNIFRKTHGAHHHRTLSVHQQLEMAEAWLAHSKTITAQA